MIGFVPGQFDIGVVQRAVEEIVDGGVGVHFGADLFGRIGELQVGLHKSQVDFHGGQFEFQAVTGA